MALVNAATLIAELGDLSRFTNPRPLAAPVTNAALPRRSGMAAPYH
jgi:transposase